jgi:hypothetical protein
MAAHDLADGVDRRVEALEPLRERIQGGRAKQVGTPDVPQREEQHEERGTPGAAWAA